jgi:hypothetical protein
MIGALATAPCGHRGEAVIGDYVRCLEGCEGAPVDAEPAPPAPAREHRWMYGPWGNAGCTACGVGKGSAGSKEPCKGNGSTTDPRTCQHPSKYSYSGGTFCSSCGKKLG